MPGDLRDPEQAYPFHHDDLYQRGPSQFEPGSEDIDVSIQSIAFEHIRAKLSPKGLLEVKEELLSKGLLNQNIGTQEFRDEVSKVIKRRKMARGVIRRWLT